MHHLGHRLWTITNYRRFPNGIVWDPKGKYVVTMSTDRKMDILSAEKGAKLRCFHAVDFKEKFLSKKQKIEGVCVFFF